MNLGRNIFVFGVLFATTIVSTAALQPCHSKLRFRRPDLFKHCECTYSDWSEWEPVPNTIGTDVSSTCESGQAFNETRRKMAIGEGCEEGAENRTICAPTQTDRLILLLGLGAKSTPQPVSLVPLAPLKRKRQVTRCRHRPECLTFWESNRGKRSTQHDMEMKDSFRHESNERKHHTPLPFSISEHGHRFRRQINNCDPNDNQHVLFVLDTSGSIPVEAFRQLTRVVADLTTLFCKQIEIAVLTFSHQFYLEFCFNCFGTDSWGRFMAADAIRNIPYRGQGGYTSTGGAAKCVCDKLLDSSCGVEFTDNTCVDVVFITDGDSNDRNFEICDQVKCLHDHVLKLNTYSLGIGNYDTPSARSELKCIQDSSNEQSLFWFETFQEFSDKIDRVTLDLLLSNTDTCTDAD